MRTVQGASDVYPEQVTGGLYLDIETDARPPRATASTSVTIQNVIETAIGETTLTTTIEGGSASPCGCATRRSTGADPQALGERPRDRVEWRTDSTRTSRGYPSGIGAGQDQQREWLA